MSRSRKRNPKKYFEFHILRSTGFLMKPLTNLDEEYIDRSKLSDQKKTVEYIVPPTSRGQL